MSLKCRRKIAGCNPCESKDKIDFLTNLALGTLWGVVVVSPIFPSPYFPNKKETRPYPFLRKKGKPKNLPLSSQKGETT